MTGNDLQSYAPLLLHLVLAMALSGVLLLLSSFVGWRRPSKVKNQAYECGITPTGDAREPFSVKFYLVAMVFILFDVEAIFLYPWAYIFRAVAVVRVRGNAPLYRNSAGGVFLSLEERGVGLEPPSRTPGPRFVTETPDLEQNPTIAKIRAWRPEAIAGLISFPRGADRARAARTFAAACRISRRR